MHILFHLGVAFLFGCVFIFGKLMVDDSEAWAGRWSRIPISAPHLCNIFLYGGRIFEATAFVGAFLEMIAVMILVGGSLIDFFVGT